MATVGNEGDNACPRGAAFERGGGVCQVVKGDVVAETQPAGAPGLYPCGGEGGGGVAGTDERLACWRSTLLPPTPGVGEGRGGGGGRA